MRILLITACMRGDVEPFAVLARRARSTHIRPPMGRMLERALHLILGWGPEVVLAGPGPLNRLTYRLVQSVAPVFRWEVQAAVRAVVDGARNPGLRTLAARIDRLLRPEDGAAATLRVLDDSLPAEP